MFNTGDKVRGEWHSEDGREHFVIEGVVLEKETEGFLWTDLVPVKITNTITNIVDGEDVGDATFAAFMDHELTALT